jgi:ribonuclease H2 subunit A
MRRRRRETPEDSEQEGEGKDEKEEEDQQLAAAAFVPPSIDAARIVSGESYSHYSPIPDALAKASATECILGIDEAGRGPVLGASQLFFFFLHPPPPLSPSPLSHCCAALARSGWLPFALSSFSCR